MDWLIDVHNIWRYVVLVTVIGALALSLLAYKSRREWDGLADRLSLFFTIALDVQVLFGILVWIFTEKHRSDTFLTWIHPALMLVAVGVAHAGRAQSEREATSRAKGAKAALFFGGSLLIVLIAIPIGAWPL